MQLPTYLDALRTDNAKLAEEIENDGIDRAEVFVSACYYGDHKIVIKMLERKCVGINSYFQGVTGLHVACKSGKTSIVYELLKHKELDLNLRIEDINSIIGGTALHIVCQHPKMMTTLEFNSDEVMRRVDIAEALLDNGADMNIKDCDGCYPIHTAIIFNNFELVKLFVLRGVD